MSHGDQPSTLWDPGPEIMKHVVGGLGGGDVDPCADAVPRRFPFFWGPGGVLSATDDHDVLHGNGKYPLLLGG